MTCKQCKYIDACMAEVKSLGQVFDINYDGEHRCTDFAPFTNADHIRSMSDEEMAETFIKGDCIGCPILYECDPYGDCKPQILNWLKQPFQGE